MMHGDNSDQQLRHSEMNEVEYSPSQPERVPFEELTISQAAGRFVRQPVETMRALWAVMSDDPQSSTAYVDAGKQQADEVAVGINVSGTVAKISPYVQPVLYLLAFVVSWFGASIMIRNEIRSETVELAQGAPFLLGGFFIWLAADIIGNRQGIRRWFAAQSTADRVWLLLRGIPVLLMLVGLRGLLDSMDDPASIALQTAQTGLFFLLLGMVVWVGQDTIRRLMRRTAAQRPGVFTAGVRDWLQKHAPTTNDRLRFEVRPLRLILLGISGLLVVITWLGTSDNTFDTPIFYTWIGSFVLASLAFAPLDFSFSHWANSWRQRLASFSLRRHGLIIVALIIIVAVGAYFRLDRLNGNPEAGTAIPQEMTSDHVELILDISRVKDGNRSIFFANNGGREPMQMYLGALFSYVPGQSVSFESLKLLAVLEAILTLPVMYWLGREIFAIESRRVGVTVALLTAAVAAVSYWHIAIARMALRIILTPLLVALLLIYLTRAIRRNTRADFIKAGILLGIGLYMYQAVRMLPIVIVIAVGVAFYFYARNAVQRVRYVQNLSVLVLISVIIFAPMLHYSIERPEEFWRRTTGRLLGDGVVETRNDDGILVYRDATFQERVEAFNDNVPVLMNNIRNAMLMFHWKGDVAWINNYPNQPALDPPAGALFMVGLAALLILILKRRDPMYALLPVILFVMLLPSALSIAYPIENPSHSRTAGAMPMTFLLVALPLGLIVVRIIDAWRGKFAVIGAGAISVIILGGSAAFGANVYFNKFPDSYILPSLPYSVGGQMLQGFAISDGSYGNAYAIAYPYWWDHRALGLASGLESEWLNGVYDIQPGDARTRAVDYVPDFMLEAYERSGMFHYDPNRDLLFFYSVDDAETSAQLKEWFPDGRETRVPTYHAEDSFMIYRVPALGMDGFQAFLALTNVQ